MPSNTDLDSDSFDATAAAAATTTSRTRPRHVADERDGEDISVEAMVAAVTQADAGQSLEPTGRPGRTSVHRPAPWDASRLLDRPAWHAATAPAEVEDAWALVLEQADKVDAAFEHFEAIKADQGRERARVAEVARRRADGDAKAKVPASTDWAAEKNLRAEVHRVALTRLRRARGAYDLAVKAALPGWRDALLDLAQRQAEALRTEAADLARKVAAWRLTVQGAEEVTGALHPDAERPQMRPTAAVLAASAVVGVRALADLLEQRDEVFEGQALREVGGSPTDYERERLRETNWSALHAIEVREDFQVSAYTKPREVRLNAPAPADERPVGVVAEDGPRRG